MRLCEVVTELLGVLLPSATVLVVEDSHWMDEASAEVLPSCRRRGRGGRPWLLCFTRRDVESGLVVPADDSTCLRLEPLGEAEATELVQVAARDAPLLAHEAAVLAERSGGNPLFLRELVAAARDARGHRFAARLRGGGDRGPHRPVVVRRPSFPSAGVGARAQRPVRPTRRGAGRGARPDDPIWARLGEFAALDEGGNLVFRHALVCDSAYDGLSYRLRRQLHARAGEAIRSAAGRHTR